MKKILITILIALSGQTAAFAADGWGVAAEALGVYAVYRSALSSMLALGEDVNAQIETKRMDLKENGVLKNEDDNRIVDSIMNRLTNRGVYALRPNSLPFLWAVNNSELFNASCYPTNYISINRALVRALENDEAALAAVLSHEMIHGLMQHSAHSYAEAVAGMMGAAMIGMHGNVDWEKLNGAVGYGVARNVILPAEKEADELGFYLMTSAGFNPGGGAAAMSRMRYYLRYETKNFLEYDGDEKSKKNISDHPETQDRELTLSNLMSEYGVGHVTVKDGEKVYIDGNLVFTARNTGASYDNTAENAYSVAGGLSKAFHDYDGFDGWNFNGNSYLNNDSAYKTLKKFIRAENIMPIIKKSYEIEDKQKRTELKAKENRRREEALKLQDHALKVQANLADKYRYRCDAYSDYLMGDMALFEIELAKNAKNQSNLAECTVMEGRAYVAKGEMAKGIALMTEGIRKDGKNEYNYLNRADAYYMQGDLTRAIADARSAVAVNGKNPVSWQLLADYLESSGDKKGAIDAYSKAYQINRDIDAPLYILAEIDKKEYEKRLKVRQNAEKALAEKYNEKHKKGRGK